jgi:hypothetical protein
MEQTWFPGRRMPGEVVDFITGRLRRSRCYLEYGAGRTSLLAVELGVPDVISVESDASFLEEVVRSARAIDSATNLHPVHADIGATGAWGAPTDRSAFAAWPGYAQAGHARAAELGLQPDFVLVDGRFRVACLLATILSTPPGTEVLIDDYAGRSHYHAVEACAGTPQMVHRAALFAVPESFDAQEAAFALARYSVVPA